MPIVEAVAVVVAVGKTESRAEAGILAERTQTFVLPAGHKALLPDVHPCLFRETSITTRTAATEAHVLQIIRSLPIRMYVHQLVNIVFF